MLANMMLLFRDDSVGIALLNQYWLLKEGHLFIDKVLNPIVHRVMKLDHVLEVRNRSISEVDNTVAFYYQSCSYFLL